MWPHRRGSDVGWIPPGQHHKGEGPNLPAAELQNREFLATVNPTLSISDGESMSKKDQVTGRGGPREGAHSRAATCPTLVLGGQLLIVLYQLVPASADRVEHPAAAVLGHVLHYALT